MQNLKVSFYVLSETKAQDFLGFICQLTQTALNKSNQSLLILVDDESLLNELDEALWQQDAVSFIPHQCLTTHYASGKTDESDSTVSVVEPITAPVLLGQDLPSTFSGIVINTTTRPVNDYIASTSTAKVVRILEIIRPDETSVAQGRDKYKVYQQLDYELTHFKV